VQLNVNYMWYG